MTHVTFLKIHSALVEQGMMDEHEITRQLKLKETFKKTKFYKYGLVWLNERQPKNYEHVKSFADLGVKKRNYVHTIATGHGAETFTLEKSKNITVVKEENRQDVKVTDIENNIIQAAISRNRFFTFCLAQTLFSSP